MQKTAECVSKNHPDKLCDRISDAIVDACLLQDPMSRCAIEVMGSHGIITVAGELTTTAFVDIPKIVKSIVGEGYGIQVNIESQSPEIAQGVDTGGAGDQGIMRGYACRDNEDMIPQELYLARSLCKFICDNAWIDDGKTQITLNDDGSIKTIVASFCRMTKDGLEAVVKKWFLKQNNFTENWPEVLINPAGDWHIGGFAADTGLTGRKLVVDNYGPEIPLGGGAFSGKDATKVDRSAAYMARKIAVDILKSNDRFQEVFIKIAYAIGVAEPVMVSAKAVEKDGSVVEHGWDFSRYNLTPKGIIEFLELRKPQFERLAREGHFGTGNIWDK